MALRILLACSALLLLSGCNSSAPTSEGPQGGGGAKQSAGLDGTTLDKDAVPEPELPPTDKTVDELMAGASDAVLTDFNKALVMALQARNKEPDNARIALNVAALYTKRAGELREDKKLEEGARHALAASKAVRRLQGKSKGEEPPQIQRMIKMATGVVLFNEARAYAILKQPQKSLKSLQDAIDAGFNEFTAIEEESDFEGLRETQEFQDFLVKAKAQVVQVARQEARREIKEQKPFPFSFALPDLKKKTVSSSDYAGKVLIVDIWGTWCPPCMAEVPHFVKLYHKYNKQGLEIVGINYERGPPETAKPKIERVVEELKIPYPCVLGDETTQAKVPNFTGFPTTLFIDRQGTVRMKLVGGQPYERLEAIVLELLEEKS